MLNFPSFFNAQVGGYEIEQSLRFNSADSAYLNRTPASAGNRKTYTISMWVKRAKLGTASRLFGAYSSPSAYFEAQFTSSDTLQWYYWNGSGYSYNRVTSQVFRDPSAWCHFVFVFNSPSATGSQRIRIYFNGQEITTFSSSTDPSQNFDCVWNSTANNVIGDLLYGGSPGSTFDGLMTEVHHVDGTALDPSSFGEFDNNGVWRPIAYTGSHGTNGFYLKFDPTATNGIGHDHSGNGNNWTANNFDTTGAINIGYPQALTAGSGSVTNPSLAFDGNTGTEAVASSSTTITFTPPTPISFSTKLEFWTASGNGPGSNDQRYSFNGGAEVTCSGGEWTTVVNGSGTLTSLAIRNTLTAISRLNAVRVDNNILLSNSGAGNDVLSDTPTTNWCTLNPLDSVAGNLINGNLEYYDTSGNGEYAVSTMSFDIVSEKYYIEYEVGTLNYNADRIGIIPETNTGIYSGTYANSHAYYAANGNKQPANTAFGASINAGDILGVAVGNGQIEYFKNGVSQGVLASGLTGRYKFASSGAANAHGVYNFGQRAFAYTPPTGFKALNTSNLTAPTVKDGGDHFNTVLYTGTGVDNHAITGVGFQPDWVWLKTRSVADNHVLQDAVRGAQKQLFTNAPDYEFSATTLVKSFDNDGFTVGTDSGANGSGRTFAAWNWKAGGTGSSNTDGSITSTVSANPSAGFSIVSYTGTGSGATVGHGLGVAPSLLIFKNRDSAENWAVWHSALDATTGEHLGLNQTNAVATNAVIFNSTSPTSTVFSIGNNGRTGLNGDDYVAYCFAEVEGYSKFGSYVGNNSSDGPFVYCGFRPRWLLVKNSTSGVNWQLRDSSRDAYNPSQQSITANTPDQDSPQSGQQIDFCSNGFKMRNSTSDWNLSGQTYIFAAFAEHPTGGSGVSPATAR